MILDISKLIKHSIGAEQKVSHFAGEFGVFERKDVPAKISKMIAENFGQSYLLDGDLILFFKEKINEEMEDVKPVNIKKMASLIERSLAKTVTVPENDIKSFEFGAYRFYIEKITIKK